MAEGARLVASARFVQGKWPLAIYVVIGLLVFVLFLVASFPYAEAVSSLLAPYKLKLVYQEEHLSPPIGVELENVQLLSDAGSPGQLLLQSPDVELTPTLGSLFLGRPGLSLRADLYGGTVGATLRQRGKIVSLNFYLIAVNLSRSEPLRQLGASLSGSLSGAGSAELRSAQISDNTARMAFDGDAVAVRITEGFPLVQLGAISGNLALDGGTLTLRNVQARGGDLEIRADGAIRLANDPRESAVNLKFLLNPTASGRAHFGFFLNLLPHPPGDGPYYLSGPLVSPSIT
jgi:type II secretion system protein N